MRGEVEVWSGDDLILREANMLTDGAGELLADIMTVSPSLATIADPATQAILDASNYTIQAISFGTGPDAFRSNAHAKDNKWNQYYSSFLQDIADEEIGNIALLRSNRLDQSKNENEQPSNGGFPSTPDPVKKVLEENTSLSSNLINTDVSSVFPGNGQLTNFLPFTIMSAVMSGTDFSSIAAAPKVASLLGCFPEGSGVTYSSSRNRVIYFDDLGTGLEVTATTGSYFNQFSSMDVSGFVNKTAGVNTKLGLTVSSNSNFASNGIVEYAVKLSKDDALFAHAYGGIYHLGMWTIDMNKTLMNGNTPPLSFSVLNNPRKYKLFCRKGVSKDLTYINNINNYQDLTIKWRIHFL